MRGIDLDTSSAIWTYRPSSHKTEHHGRQRVIRVGPRAQAVIRPWLKHDLDAYLFSPHAEAEKVLVGDGVSRKGNRVEDRKRPPQDHYTTASYRRAIARACQRAKVSQWRPNQLRHTSATTVAREFGDDAARAVLGHSSVDTTMIYVERDSSIAAEVMRRIGQ